MRPRHDGGERPAPLVPPEVDLRDFAFMPLDVRRLLSSETWIEAAEDPQLGHALMCLWCESWHQVPASSLPDNDKVLARLAMCTADEWVRLKDRALAGWVKAADGLLYHPVVAEKALEAWARKQAQRERTKRATEERERRRRERDEQRNDQRHVQRDEERNVHQGTGTETETVYSVPNGTERQAALVNGQDHKAAEPSDPVKALFDLGVHLLTGSGTPERQARSLVGKWRKQLGEDGKLLNLLLAAHKNAAIEPVGYVTKAIEREIAQRQNPNGRVLL